jgi:toxin ParE1/3/4
MKAVRLSRYATLEIERGVKHYNDARPGLGDEFRDEVESLIDLIGKQPKAFTPYGRGYRKCVVRRFPYSIFYLEYDDHVWIAAVYHSSRKPDAWMNRSPENGDTNGQPAA